MTAEIRGRKHFSRGDGGRRIRNAVDAYHFGLVATSGSGEGLRNADSHVVIGAEDRVDHREALHQILEDLYCREAAIIARLRGEKLDARGLFHRPIESLLAILRGDGRRNTVDMHDLPFSAHRLKQIF